jgi:transcriptional regulator with XRE-family HTH domain
VVCLSTFALQANSLRGVSTADAYKREIALLRRHFASGLRSRREDRFHSQEAFADHAHLHRTTVGGLEQGRTDPRLSTLLIVADALDVSVAELVEGLPVPKERKPPPPAQNKAGKSAPRKG